ncbi:MAG: hypothetical protein QOG67_3087 [Verrucomicrobiota bacterium]|jgi:predicted GIY-YIG superfamily endonuclease
MAFWTYNGPWQLVWVEERLSRADAVSRERQIKSWKSAKLIRERLLDTEK